MGNNFKDKQDKQQKIIKATQIAFELEQDLTKKIQNLAMKENLSTSSVIRKIIGLDYTPPKRPRISISLNDDDYKLLSEKYGLEASEKSKIKAEIIKELAKLL